MKEDDIIIFKIDNTQYKYIVFDQFLNCVGTSNSIIFERLGIVNEKYKLASECYGYESKYGDWPEFKLGDFEAAQRLVDKLQEMCKTKSTRIPIYKVGDRVRIKKREGETTDYPYSFSNEMTKLEGKEFIIKSIIQAQADYSSRKYYQGDDHIYILDGETYNWHSSMFEPANIIEDQHKEADSKLILSIPTIDLKIHIDETEPCLTINKNFLKIIIK